MPDYLAPPLLTKVRMLWRQAPLRVGSLVGYGVLGRLDI